MALFHGANQKLIDHKFLNVAPIAVYNRVNLHVAGSLGSLFGFRSHVNRPSSHFWVSQAGDVERMQAWAGQSAGLASTRPAGDIARDLWAGAQALLR